MQEPKKQGGARPGAGRKSKFNEPSVTASFRVPESKSEHIKMVVERWIRKNF